VSPHVTPADVKRLRDQTGAGMMDCKRALLESGGDFEQAKLLLRKWGLAGVARRSQETASEGVIETYLHRTSPDLPARVGVMVELDCQTDFVANTPEFSELAREIAMHIAWADPQWVSMKDVPQDVIEQERKILLESDLVAGKPPQVVEKIVEGKLKDRFAEQGGVLLEQPYVRDGKRTVADFVADYAARVKENVVVRRFARFKVGEPG
jgi:elongation factor Ts